MITAIFISLLAATTLFIGLFLAYAKIKKIDRWLVSYALGIVRKPKLPKDKPIDILFLFVDHFELNGHEDRLKAWTEGYPKIASKHTDSDGHHPKHTFFYAMDLMHEHELVAMKPVVDAGYGEFELHWHHDHDTEQSFVQKLEDAMVIFHKHGYMQPYLPDQQASFGFIHGNWSLANARGDEFCGVDNEVRLLKDMGCYADFTYPALFSTAQPPFINNIYYCDQIDQPSCHFKGKNASVGKKETDDEFMIVQGPMTINWRDWRHKWHPTIEDGDINQFPTHDDPKRIDAWMKQNICVEGRPEWRFVKIFCHGAQDHKSVVSETTDRMYQYIEDNYNDGKKYRLHYISAREAYNIIKAAEAGESGNPNQFRDYVIPHPNNRNMDDSSCAV